MRSETDAAPAKYVTSRQLSERVRMDLFSPGMFRLRKAIGSQQPAEAVVPLPVPGEGAADSSGPKEAASPFAAPPSHTEDAKGIGNKGGGGSEFAPRYEIPFCVGRLAAWPAVAYEIRRSGDTQIVTTAEMQIRVDVGKGTFDVWSVDGSRRIHPSDGPRVGLFQGQSVTFSDRPRCFYSPASGYYSDMTSLDLFDDEYFIHAPDYATGFARFNELVGPEPLLPRKAYGYMQTQHLANDGNQERFMAMAAKMRERRIPCDVLILDYEWGDGCDGAESWRWGSRREWAKSYSTPLKPSEMLAALHRQHYELMIIHHSQPGIANIEADPWLLMFKQKLDMGVAGTWQDTRGQDRVNAAIWSAQQRHCPGRRVYFIANHDTFLNNGWGGGAGADKRWVIGARRYPFHWTGDCDMTWKELAYQVKAITGGKCAMMGVTYLNSDTLARNWKVHARWHQFTAFCPVARSHTLKPWTDDSGYTWTDKIAKNPIDCGMRMNNENLIRWHVYASRGGDPKNPRVLETLAETPIDWSESAEASVRKHLSLRYRLLPYVYSLAHENYRTGMPICRPMLLVFPRDAQCNADQWPLQYMFGQWLLVAPVCGDLASMKIYLPAGESWVDYWDGTEHQGGQVLDYDTRQVDKLPLFVRRGAILPMRPEGQWIDPAVSDSPVTLDVYPNAQESAFDLYEDDGVSPAYQRGQFRTTAVRVSRPGQGQLRVNIGAAKGQYEGAAKTRSWIVRIHLPSGEAPEQAGVDGRNAVTAVSGGVVEVTVPEGDTSQDREVSLAIGRSASARQ